MTESYLEPDTVDSVKVKSGYNVVADLEYGNEAARLTDLLGITELEVCVEPIGLLTFQRLRTNVARDSMPDDSRRSISVPSSLSWFSRRILLWRKLNLTNQKRS